MNIEQKLRELRQAKWYRGTSEDDADGVNSPRLESYPDWLGSDERVVHPGILDLRRQQLAGTDLSNVSAHGILLTASDLRGARFVGADLSSNEYEVGFVAATFWCFSFINAADLREAHFVRTNLRAAKLGASDLRRAELRSSDCSHVDFRGIRLDETVFVETKLAHADLRGVDLTSCELSRCDLSGADLRGAKLTNAQLLDNSFRGASLDEFDFSNSSLCGVDFSGASLLRARLDRASLDGANLANANLSGASMREASLVRANLRGVLLRETQLPLADARDADLSKASLIGAHLRGTLLRRADLTSSAFSDADVRGADLRQATGTQSRWENARMEGALMEGGTYQGATFVGADLRGANPTGADLGGANLRFIRICRSDLPKFSAQVIAIWRDQWLIEEGPPVGDSNPAEIPIRYDVAISYATEDFAVASELAHTLRRRGISIFFDRFETAELWGKNLYDHLFNVYSQRAQFVLVLVSRAYTSSTKRWTRHELQAAQQGQLEASSEYILPVTLDGEVIPTLPATLGYLDVRNGTIDIVAAAVEVKLARERTTPGSSPAR